jgi:hypothetical protein
MIGRKLQLHVIIQYETISGIDDVINYCMKWTKAMGCLR